MKRRGVLSFGITAITVVLLFVIISNIGRSPVVEVYKPLPPPKTPLSNDPKIRETQEDSPEMQALVAQDEEWKDNQPDPPKGATAKCVDGSYSFAKNKDDACRNHRGIVLWLADAPPK